MAMTYTAQGQAAMNAAMGRARSMSCRMPAACHSAMPAQKNERAFTAANGMIGTGVLTSVSLFVVSVLPGVTLFSLVVLTLVLLGLVVVLLIGGLLISCLTGLTGLAGLVGLIEKLATRSAKGD
ncbi:hypothetical protein EI42_00389 [Thermosporothrix hazakensis]|uniref:Uncharacterized protein n=1 Tax=Thermosporothrix hazakensis TaxID=644383 RepID=A0A326UCK3_THEHA|nr:hypothetical protein [Thermosporothrix hazakensis]PZW36217.1 hypothetical protein EI42_00389 [Thermosporothrix hazakensis]GCE46867.1 hypothetical protein KTH_17360 [Thermosporothrix hazakensis]